MWICPKCGRKFDRQDQQHYCGTPKTIDEYIATQDARIQPFLKEVRNAIRTSIPDAEECISWSMPTYRKGRNLIHFATAKNHIGLYPGEEATAVFATELTGYNTSKGTIRLPYTKPLPVNLIARIAQWCYKQYGA